jgi:hypothetical protein
MMVNTENSPLLDVFKTFDSKQEGAPISPGPTAPASSKGKGE